MGKSNENFKRICKEKGVKIIEVSRATGIANSTLYEWSRGLYTPKIDKLTKIADFLNVDVNELVDDDIASEHRIPSPALAPEYVELIDIYSRLNEYDKHLLLEMARNMAERNDLLKMYMGVIETPTS